MLSKMKTNKASIGLLLQVFVLLMLVSACGGGGGGESDPDPKPDSRPTYTVVPIFVSAGEIISLQTNSSTFYWSGNGIWKYSTGDADRTQLVPVVYEPEQITVQGSYFYWTDIDRVYASKRRLYRSSLDGSETVLLKESQDNWYQRTIMVDDSAVYWVVQDSNYKPVLERVPLDGSSSQTLYTAAQDIKSPAQDSSFIYWIENSSNGFTLFRIPKTGGSVESLCTLLQEPVTNMVVYNNEVYYGGWGAIVKVPASGGSSTVVVPAATGMEPTSIVVTATDVYWINRTTHYNNAQVGGYNAVLSAPTNTIGTITIISPNLQESRNLHATADGLYWIEFGPKFTKSLKRRLWGSGSDEVLQGGMYFWSIDPTADHVYYTEKYFEEHYSVISRISLTNGQSETLKNGINNGSGPLLLVNDQIIFGDGFALKTVSMAGGKVETLLLGAGSNNARFSSILEKDGIVYFSWGGIYAVPVTGGPTTLLATDLGSYHILSVQDGYVYYTWTLDEPNVTDLHRVPVAGGVPEVVYTVPTSRTLLRFEGITTAYVSECIWNDQHELIMVDIATGNEVLLTSGRFQLLGTSQDAVFVSNLGEIVYRIPKTGGTSDNILTVPYPIALTGYWQHVNAEDFYIGVYLDNYYEIDLLKRLK